MLARNMGDKHYMIRNESITTFGPNEWHKVRLGSTQTLLGVHFTVYQGIKFGEGFHGSACSLLIIYDKLALTLASVGSIPVNSTVVADLIRLRLTQPEEDVEE